MLLLCSAIVNLGKQHISVRPHVNTPLPAIHFLLTALSPFAQRQPESLYWDDMCIILFFVIVLRQYDLTFHSRPWKLLWALVVYVILEHNITSRMDSNRLAAHDPGSCSILHQECSVVGYNQDLALRYLLVMVLTPLHLDVAAKVLHFPTLEIIIHPSVSELFGKPEEVRFWLRHLEFHFRNFQ
jgi:hypothetical protein